MFNIGFTEFLVIGVIALIVIGPKQLPEVARVVGKLLGEIKNATQELSGGLLDVTKEVKNSIDDTKSHIVNEGRKIMDDVTRTDASLEHEPHEPEDEYDDLEEHHHLEEEHPHTELEKKPGPVEKVEIDKADKEKVDGN
jgi:sec-independent protein translocase protein TatB